MTDQQTQPRWIEYMRVDALVPDERNPKGHSLDDMRASLGRFGYTAPIEIDERTGKLVSGHGRTEMLAAEHAAGAAVPDGILVDDDGEWLVPVVRGWSSANDAEAGAYLIAANKLTEAGGWIDAPLAALLREIDTTTPARLDGIGVTADEFARLAASLNTFPPVEPRLSDRDDVDELPPVPTIPVTRPGDVWLLGPHRVMCGDCRDAGHVAQLLDGATINVAVTSPPYADRRAYDESSGFTPIAPDDYVEWFEPVAANVAAHLADDGSWFVNIKPGADGLDRELYVYDLALAHVRAWGWHLGDEFCWQRNGVPGRVALRFKNQWESVFHFARARWKMRPTNVRHRSDNAILPAGPGNSSNTAELQGLGTPGGIIPIAQHPKRGGRGGFGGPGSALYGSPENRQGQSKPRDTGEPRDGDRKAGIGENQGEPGVDAFDGLREEGWAYPGNRLPTLSGSHEAVGHAAAYPVGLPLFFVNAYTDPGDVIFDPFLGSGSTLLATHDADRVGYGMELSPAYVDMTLTRFERLTGIVPVLASTGEPRSFAAEV